MMTETWRRAETESLVRYLDQPRDIVDGLPDAALTRAVIPSGWMIRCEEAASCTTRLDVAVRALVLIGLSVLLSVSVPAYWMCPAYRMYVVFEVERRYSRDVGPLGSGTGG